MALWMLEYKYLKFPWKARNEDPDVSSVSGYFKMTDSDKVHAAPIPAPWRHKTDFS